jgi:hypothetical protein
MMAGALLGACAAAPRLGDGALVLAEVLGGMVLGSGLGAVVGAFRAGDVLEL